MTRLLALLTVIVSLLSLHPMARADEVIDRPTWTIGDWWEANGIRQTVVGASGDRYEIMRTWAGTLANPDDGSKQRLYMTNDGWVAESIDRDGKATKYFEDTRSEWVRFPLRVGSRWSFVLLGNDAGMGSSQRYDHDCRAVGWDEIEFARRTVRALRIECKSSIRGFPFSGWFHNAWYAPEAKRVVRLTSQYAGGPALEISAWGVRPDGGSAPSPVERGATPPPQVRSPVAP